MELSAAVPAKTFVEVLGRRMAHVDVGTGSPIVLLHGNPTSSYLWRNLFPVLSRVGRCLAPDLIGMGDSEKLPVSGPGSYTLAEHRRYLDAWMDALDLRRDVTLVVHDWGSALGFDWASRHPDAVRGIAYMEALVRPLSWEDWPPRGIFQRLRSPEGDRMVLQDNAFVEVILPRSVLRGLSDAEMEEYRRPYLEPGESRRPTLTWPRQIPLDGDPPEVAEVVARYAAWLETSQVPKLLVNADPGAILVGAQRDYCRTWPNQREVTVRGSHFLQEDSPHEIATAIAEWLGEVAPRR